MSAIRALMAGAIDYAGLFPPAGLDMQTALRNYAEYRAGADAWALGRFVAPEAKAADTGLEDEALSLISGSTEIAGETKYFESDAEALWEIAERGGRGKIRTGGLEARMFPSTDTVAEFITRCARLELPFKATAGLHHALRGEYSITYEPESASTTMHGFLNVLLAACFAWHEGPVTPILEETDARSFKFSDDGAEWCGQSLTVEQIEHARRHFILSIGSCSFEEPMRELRDLGLL